MTEIRLDVDLHHAPERVWLALTDRRQLGEWLLPTEVDPTDPSRFRLRAGRADGFSGPLVGEVVEAMAPARIVMRWHGDDLHVYVSMEIEQTPDGCRLTFVQRGFFGRTGTLRRRLLRAAYARMLTERLPALLDRRSPVEPAGEALGTVASVASGGATTAPAALNVATAPPAATKVAAARRNAGGFRTRRVPGPAVRAAVRGWVYGTPAPPPAAAKLAGVAVPGVAVPGVAVPGAGVGPHWQTLLPASAQVRGRAVVPGQRATDTAGSTGASRPAYPARRAFTTGRRRVRRRANPLVAFVQEAVERLATLPERTAERPAVAVGVATVVIVFLAAVLAALHAW